MKQKKTELSKRRNGRYVAASWLPSGHLICEVSTSVVAALLRKVTSVLARDEACAGKPRKSTSYFVMSVGVGSSLLVQHGTK